MELKLEGPSGPVAWGSRALRRLRRVAGRAVRRLRRTSVADRVAAAVVVRNDPWRDRDDIEVLPRRDGHRLARRCVTRPWEVAEQNRKVVTSLLDEVDAPFFDVGGEGVLRSTIAVPEPGWGPFLQALGSIASDGSQDPLYVDLVSDGDKQTGLLGVDHFDLDREITEVRVYRIQSWDAIGARGFESRCQVQRWAERAIEGEDGHVEYVAPTVNPLVTAVADTRLQVEDRTDWGRSRRRLADIKSSPLTPEPPIDVVYLWVDGSDPAWRRRMLHAKGITDVDSHSSHDSRFRDRGELKHSIRSLLTNAPWVGHIFLVTDDQIPQWLDTSSPRLTVVDHREIFSDAARLPTFNSHAIGSRLHHIDGLAERYLLMNDDVFFNRPAAPELFFTGNGSVVLPLARTTVSLASDSQMSPVDSARRNSMRLIEREYGRTPTRLFRHTPVPQLRSLMAELEQRFPDVFAHLEKSQFRSHDDHVVNSWLHHYVALMTNRGVVGRYDYGYFNLARDGAWNGLRALRPSSSTVTFCINDVGDGDGGDHSADLESWLAGYFPEPSAVER